MDAIERRRAVQRALVPYYSGAIDGQFGPKTYAAVDVLRDAENFESIGLVEAPLSAMGLRHNEWPKEELALEFFGYPPNLTFVEPPYPIRMFYDGKWHSIVNVQCSMKVALSLRRIFAAILQHYGTFQAIQSARMDVYDGCYNDRNVRGSATKRSMHAYGAAIDFDAEHNQLGAPVGRMPSAVVEIFKAEGWRWGGEYHTRKDWMHFEACI